MKSINKLTIILFLVFLSSCTKDFLDKDPGGKVSEDKINDFVNKGGDPITAQVNGMYSYLISYNTLERESEVHDDFGHMSEMLATDLMTEDMVQTSQGYGYFWNYYQFNARKANNRSTLKPWGFYYRVIENSNVLIKKIPVDTDNETFRSALGQAYALRAWAYFYLCLIYQDGYHGNEDKLAVPIVSEKTTDFSNNPRASLKKVYDFMFSDLETSISLLEGFERDSKVYIDKSVACAIMARVCLNMEDWKNVIKYTNLSLEVSESQLMSRDAYLEGFNDINNVEWMWGADLTPETPAVETGIINFFSHIGNRNYGYASAGGSYKCMDSRLTEAIPESDIRKKCFIKTKLYTGFNVKFGPYGDGYTNAQDYVFMRRAEVILMLAEGLAMDNRSGEAADILFDFVKERDPEYIKSTKTGLELREEIYFQRRIELWGEGFSLNDVKRLRKKINRNYEGTNHVELTNIEPGDSKLYFQIPQNEMDANLAIVQNPN